MDEINSLYYTHESFDATYPGYGSTYGDLQGGLALLFEQASSRGHLQETPSGELSFQKTILHQFLMSLTTVRTAVEHREYLSDYQYRFFKDALKLAKSSKIKGYTFGDPYDRYRTQQFISLLQRHKIQVGHVDNNKYFVPVEQNQYLLIKHFFEPNTAFRDSVFYDASAWALAYAYNMHPQAMRKIPSGYSPLDNTTPPVDKSITVRQTSYAWLMDWDQALSPAALYAIMDKGYTVRVANKGFRCYEDDRQMDFRPGTIVIALADQKDGIDFKQMTKDLKLIATTYQVPLTAISTGLSLKGIDMGSPNINVLKKPKIALITGNGVNAYEAGEVWFLFDYKMHIPIVKIPTNLMSRVPLSRYTTIIMTSGSYTQLSKSFKDDLKRWVHNGGTLVGINRAVPWLIQQKIVPGAFYKIKKDSTKVERRPYNKGYGDRGKSQVSGVILRTDLDITHPIAYGYHQNELPVYKKSNFWLKPAKNIYATVAKYKSPVLISGYVSKENKKNFLDKEPASILAIPMGSGQTVLFSDNPVFRGTWPGTEKLLLNAVMFGPQISAGGGGRRNE